jgi:hypothetical protein
MAFTEPIFIKLAMLKGTKLKSPMQNITKIVPKIKYVRLDFFLNPKKVVLT